jgi:hypothetical protein
LNRAAIARHRQNATFRMMMAPLATGTGYFGWLDRRTRVKHREKADSSRAPGTTLPLMEAAMADKDAEWQDKAKQYLRAEKKQLEEEREAEIVRRREDENTDTKKSE